MKIPISVLCAAFLAYPVVARGRGGKSKGKGKSAVEDEGPTCECLAPTVQFVDLWDANGDGVPDTPITNLDQAVRKWNSYVCCLVNYACF